MAGELLWRKREFAIRRLALGFGSRIVIGIHDQLPFDFHGLIHLVIEVQSPAESARGWESGLCQYVWSPNRRHANWRIVIAFDNLVLLVPRCFRQPVGVDRLAARCDCEHDKRGKQDSSCHGNLSLRSVFR
jgi:hypothetical protein